MTKEMYEDLLERARLQISELNTLTEEQDKHIIELEKKVSKLEFALENMTADYNKLEKGNAELKRDKEDLIFVRNQKAACMCEDKEKLTKAKEIIINLLRTLKNENSDFTFALKYTHPVLREAEQFLKEADK